MSDYTFIDSFIVSDGTSLANHNNWSKLYPSDPEDTRDFVIYNNSVRQLSINNINGGVVYEYLLPIIIGDFDIIVKTYIPMVSGTFIEAFLTLFVDGESDFVLTHFCEYGDDRREVWSGVVSLVETDISLNESTVWLRAVRLGSIITSKYSYDGITWTDFNTTSVPSFISAIRISMNGRESDYESLPTNSYIDNIEVNGDDLVDIPSVNFVEKADFAFLPETTSSMIWTPESWIAESDYECETED